MLGAFRAIAPLVLTVHDTNPFNGDPSARLQAAGMARCFAAFDRLVVHTRQGLGRLIEQGVPPDQVALLPHGSLPVPGDPGADLMLGPPTFVLFGKIKPYKGADLLIEAFARLPQTLRDQARVRIVGKTYMDLAPLHRAIGAHGLADRIVIEPRFVPDAEIPAILGRGTVAVFPYREIEASGVLMQALALRRPVIATRLGNMAEILTDGVEGRLVPPEDVPALANAMAQMIQDPAFRAACSHSARLNSDQTEPWDSIARKTMALYAEARSASWLRNRATDVSSRMKNSIGGNC